MPSIDASGLPAACARFRETLEAYLDGDLPPAEAERARAHLEAEAPPNDAGDVPGCAACRREVRRATRLRVALRGLPAEACPDGVAARVLAVAREEAALRGRTARRFGAGAPARWLRLGALAAAAAALLWLGVRATQEPAPRPVAVQAGVYTAEELARAEVELRLALGYVAAIGRRSGVTLRDDVLVGEVLEPSAAALERAFAADPLPWSQR
jgi:anti-sigma factor RsiW